MAFAAVLIRHDQGCLVHDGGAEDALKPKVVMMVGRKADIEPKAQFEAKYMTPAAYI